MWFDKRSTNPAQKANQKRFCKYLVFILNLAGGINAFGIKEATLYYLSMSFDLSYLAYGNPYEIRHICIRAV
ncbi:MAG: hypothetical protein CV087_16275 [Candidatus Brocadia sp. WS118]|nr:MAG: hypothetical protein CV087_16275 [Candidatus Brocadia sp. WS118]